ncbi:MAG: SPOR domain-containing protein [Succinivibrionaceae bacterium]|nr:SPOR domain-containing protein [Succinivibrionaceae bacterium]
MADSRPAPRQKPEQKPEQKPRPTPSQRPSGAYSVQVGVFSQQGNADKIMTTLRAGGVATYSERVTVGGKQMIKVYAGSAQGRDALRGVLQKVKRLTGTEGKIVAVQK